MKFSLLSPEEVQFFRQRLTLILLGIGLCFALVAGRLFYLQVVRGQYYAGVAQGNRIRVVPQEAPRGLILDRNGELLAYNRPAFNVQLMREDTPDLEGTLRRLAQVSEVPYGELFAAATSSKGYQRFKATDLLTDVPRKAADLVDTYQDDLPGISVQVEPRRLYPNAFLASHIVGYVGDINESQLQALPLKKLRSGRVVGQSGVEFMQNAALIGLDGGRQVEVDNVGRELRVLNAPVNPVPGSDITLTIDLRLQRYIKSLMGKETGAVVVTRPKTGEILALSSFPDFDPNQFVGGIEDQRWEELSRAPGRPLLNRATQGLYSPGSTFKLVLALAALDQGVLDVTTKLNCPGFYKIGRDIRYCWKRPYGHGWLTLREALEQSCNVFFYQVGLELGIDRINEYARLLGFGARTGIELESEKTGLVPSRAWKQETQGERWFDGETLPISIGQGFTTVTPLQLVGYINIVANRGLWVQPTIFKRIVSPDGEEILRDGGLPRASHQLPIPPEYFDTVREGLVWAVNRNGTARRGRSRKVLIAGKTGTTQTRSRPTAKSIDDVKLDNEDQHALFIGFAPADNPQVSVAVLIEREKSGGGAAAQVARQTIDYFFDAIEPVAPRPAPAAPPAPPPPPTAAAAVTGGEAFARELNRAFAGSPQGAR
ncbi:MAG: penicillin-binding protein 2 [Candidatus Lambdaproteobacteria bacterium]|nr:penicillin-binding protein 2 [Candidatus Lambdaproteobacteria bacterium]